MFFAFIVFLLNLSLTIQEHSTLNISKLILASPRGFSSSLQFLHGDYQNLLISLLSETGTFVIKNHLVSIIELDKSDIITFNVHKLSFQGLKYNGDFNINLMPQWKLYINEDFWAEPYGWTNTSISTCGGINMLGGFGILAGGEIKKEFKDLPTHNTIRIKASFHFIDAWSGETGFMRISSGKNEELQYVWTEKHDFSKGANVTSICGAKYPENKLTSGIDVSLPHNNGRVVIGFGSTLDQDAFENSYGISNFEIWLK